MSNNIERFVNRHIAENNLDQPLEDYNQKIILYDANLNLDLLENDKYYNFFEKERIEEEAATDINKPLINLISKVKQEPKNPSNSSLVSLVSKMLDQSSPSEIYPDIRTIETESYPTETHYPPKKNNNLSTNLVNKFFNSNIVKIKENNDEETNNKETTNNDEEIYNEDIRKEETRKIYVNHASNYTPPIAPEEIKISNRIKKLSVISNQPDISKPRTERKYEDSRVSSKQKHLHYMLGQQRLNMLISESTSKKSITDDEPKDTILSSAETETGEYLSVGTSPQHKPSNDKKKIIDTIINDHFNR
jgi:hypothetical protein